MGSKKFYIQTQRHEGFSFFWQTEKGRYPSVDAAKAAILRRYPKFCWESWGIFDVQVGG